MLTLCVCRTRFYQAGAAAGLLVGGPLIALGGAVALAGVAATQPMGRLRATSRAVVASSRSTGECCSIEQLCSRCDHTRTQLRSHMLTVFHADDPTFHDLLTLQHHLDSFKTAQAVHQKHHVTKRVKAASQRGLAAAAHFDQQHHVTLRAAAAASQMLSKAREIEAQHGISHKAGQAALKSLTRANTAMEGSRNGQTVTSTRPPPSRYM